MIFFTSFFDIYGSIGIDNIFLDNFSDIEKYLTDNNYKLIAIDRIINFFSNKYMYFNAIYIREDIFNKLNLN